MISGLRNDWETWPEMEKRNRDNWRRALAFTMRIANPIVDLESFERMEWQAFADEAERFLDASAAALGGERQDLNYFIGRNGVHWRERNYSVITARMGNDEIAVPYRRSVLEIIDKSPRY